MSRIKIRIRSKRLRMVAQRADPREGPFGLYGFCASHTGIYLSYAEHSREDFFM
jgi:hypothetical protein